MKLKVVINTSPLLYLAKMNKLRILRDLFQDVYTTREVMDEVEKPLKSGIVSPEISIIMKADWIRVVKLKWEDELTARNLSARLGIARGEAGVAVLYQELKADLLIVQTEGPKES